MGNAEKKEAQILAEEVKLTLGLLARLDRADEQRDELINFIANLEHILRTGLDKPKAPPLVIVPRNTSHLKPRPAPKLRIALRAANLPEAVSQLSWVYKRLASMPESQQPNTTTAAQLVFGGARKRKRGICGYKYARNTMKAVAHAHLPLDKTALKLATVADLIRTLYKQRKKVAIFCVHRAVATAVARHLAAVLGIARRDIFDATPASQDEQGRKLERFREKHSGPKILVTTDKLSEARDLHQACDCLVHFELPWSPLRVLQRVGRLWRIRSAHSSLPRAPHVFHVVHPGGVEEEILWRLRRRWGYLSTLGLGYMTSEVALGKRVPSVAWDLEDCS
jgi:superfamily II DNA or RNA helicase